MMRPIQCGRGIAIVLSLAAAAAGQGLLQRGIEAAPVYDVSIRRGDPGDVDRIIGRLLQREDGVMPSATFLFFDTPAPAGDGTLRVIAAGDLGVGLDDSGNEVREDFLRVFGEGRSLGRLFEDTDTGLSDPGCPLVSRFDPVRMRREKVENLGFMINDDGKFIDEAGSVLPDGAPISARVVCGPSFHNAVDDEGKNVLSEEGHRDAPALDRLTIPQAELTRMVADGRISFTLLANSLGGTGIGSLKYVDREPGFPFAVRLTYPVSGPTPLVLLALGIVGAGLRRRRASPWLVRRRTRRTATLVLR